MSLNEGKAGSLSYPFDCITEFMFFETDMEPADVILLVCKSYHARRALLTYQTVFSRDTMFCVSAVTDNTGITKDNWYQDERKITIVFKELTKIGQYFGHHVPNWVNG